MPPILCINADFEMAWSGRRVPDDPARDDLFAETPETIIEILEIFDRYEIPITWGTVGALLLTKPFDFGRFAQFNGVDPFFHGQWYAPPAWGSPRGRLFYAPRTVERILNAKVKHEIGCHTFTHLYLGAGSVSRERFAMELEACREAAESWGVNLETFIYPSQFIKYPDLLPEMGYKIYRQDRLEWFRFGKPYVPSFYINRRNRLRRIVGGIGKLIDERLCFPPRVAAPVTVAPNLTMFTGSTFLPGFHGVSKLVTVGERVCRISKGIDQAIRENSLFSFFFHPWHFNRRRAESLEALRRICEYAARRRKTDGLRIVTAGSLVQTDIRP
ncbi:MAG: hypothetical protein ACOX6D_09175 [Thermoguttaceae bacterium]|jgi:peptidoglycan/xylan/chitin deacetylase (PgdA/CDA1 family)